MKDAILKNEPTELASKILALQYLGVTCELYSEGSDVEIWQREMDTDLLADVDRPPSDGLWVLDCAIVDNGEGDWPGTRECILDGTWRPATRDEALRFRDNDSPFVGEDT